MQAYRERRLKKQGSLYYKKDAVPKMNTDRTYLGEEMYYCSVCLFLILECKTTRNVSKSTNLHNLINPFQIQN